MGAGRWYSGCSEELKYSTANQSVRIYPRQQLRGSRNWGCSETRELGVWQEWPRGIRHLCLPSGKRWLCDDLDVHDSSLAQQIQVFGSAMKSRSPSNGMAEVAHAPYSLIQADSGFQQDGVGRADTEQSWRRKELGPLTFSGFCWFHRIMCWNKHLILHPQCAYILQLYQRTASHFQELVLIFPFS